MTWADRARTSIDSIRMETGLSGRELRIELRKRYPFGDRKGYRYRVWLNEVARVCGRSRRTKSDTLEMFPDLG